MFSMLSLEPRRPNSRRRLFTEGERSEFPVRQLHFEETYSRLVSYFSSIPEETWTNEIIVPNTFQDTNTPFNVVNPCEDRECSICCESELNSSSCIELNICKHRFHLDCIQRWFQTKPTCPYCRMNYQHN